MIILSIDTVCETCATALMRDNIMLSQASTILGKGHAEYLPTQVETVIQEANTNFADIEKIAVNIGPGSFTGIRVGVAFARGLALALKKPALGINNLEVIAFEAAAAFPNRPVIVIQETSYERFFVATYNQNGDEISAPQNASADDIAKLFSTQMVFTGSGAKAITTLLQLDATIFEKPHADIISFAQLAQKKLISGAPSPLYLHAPDAKPNSGFTLARKE